MSINVISIPLSQLRVLPEVQSRVKINTQVVADYRDIIMSEMESAAEEKRPPAYPFHDPLLVVQDGNSRIVADGFHRVEAYKNPVTGEFDDPAMLVNVIVQPPFGDWTPLNVAKYLSNTANTTHGVSRTKQDKINAVMLHLQVPYEFDKSDTAIAKALKVDRRHHVAVARRLLEAGHAQYVDLPTESDQSDRSGLPAESGLMSPPPQDNAIDETLQEAGSNSAEELNEMVRRRGIEHPHMSEVVGGATETFEKQEDANNMEATTTALADAPVTVITDAVAGQTTTSAVRVAVPPPTLATPSRTADAPTPATEAPESAEQPSSGQGRLSLMQLQEVLQYVRTARSALQILPLPTVDTLQEHTEIRQELFTEIQELTQDFAKLTGRINGISVAGRLSS